MSTVRLATPADADEVGRVLADGFADDPVMGWVFGEPGRHDKLTTFFGFLAREAFVPLGATDVVPGGCACWTPPRSPDWPPERGERFGSLLAEVCPPDDLERLGILDAVQKQHHPDGPLWYLSTIAVEQTARGSGLGSSLLAASLRRVDDAGLPAYLESTNPRNVSFYRRHGFRVLEEVELPDGPVLTTMWRDPVPA